MVNNINAQTWLDQKYPKEGICERKSDQTNKGKTREQIIELNLSKGNLGKHFYSSGDGDKILVGSLKLEGFTKLRKLIISAHQITELDVSECGNLVELDCRNNQIDNLNVSNCSNLKIVNCSSNHIKELDLGTCPKVEEVDINSCPELASDKIKSELYHDINSGKLIKNKSQKSIKTVLSQIRKVESDDIRNILIVGITGNGKSTLANVLTSTNQFKESSSSTSATKNFQGSDVFQWENKSYRVIDNIGFSDTNNISKEDILFKIGEGIHEAKEGINQVLFIFKDRFSEDQINAFKLFKDFIAETGITKFTTIVKTGFENFRNQQRCEEDRKVLFNQTKELKEIIDSCNGFIYVDNPAIPIVKIDDDEEVKEVKEKLTKVNKRSREKSRKIVFEHLVKNCSEIYKLKEWDSIYAMVENYNKKKEQIEQSNSINKEEELKQAKTELVKKVDKTIEGSVGASLPMPGFPINFNISAKYEAHTEIPPKN